VQHAWLHMYRSRKQRKRDFRALWIQRINAASRVLGVSYSKLIGKLGHEKIELNRKMLAEIAISDPVAFEAIVKA
jgi:large subunit ribosomal protein L20